MDAATPNQLLGWWIQITWCFPAFIVPSVLATSQTMTEPPPVQSLNLKIVKYKTRLTLSEKAATVQEKVLMTFLKKNNLENYCSRLLYEIFSLYSCKQNTKKWGVTQYLFTAQHHTVSDKRREAHQTYPFMIWVLTGSTFGFSGADLAATGGSHTNWEASKRRTLCIIHPPHRKRL